MSEALSLESFVMAAVSVCVGIACAVRFKVVLVVVISALAMVAAIFAALLFDGWDIVVWIVTMMILMQASYLAGAVAQSWLQKR